MPPMILQGIVTKVGFMDKTATVTVTRWVAHKITGRSIQRSRKFLVHDDQNKLRQDDLITIQNCPPISRRKRFTLKHVLKSPLAERELARARFAEENATTSTSASSGNQAA